MFLSRASRASRAKVPLASFLMETWENILESGTCEGAMEADTQRTVEQGGCWSL